MATRAEIVLSASDRTRAAFESAKKNLAGLDGVAAAVTSRIGLIGSAIAAAFGAASLKGVIDGADQLQKLSQSTGVTVENLSALKYAGELSNVSVEDLAQGFKKLGNNMAAAAGGNKEAAASFKAIGVDLKTSSGALRSTDEVLADIAERFASYEDGASKAALATELFGRNGAALIPFLNAGKKGLAEMRTEAEQLGVVMSGDLARQAEVLNDNLTRLGAAAQGAKLALLGELLPALVATSEAFVRNTRESGLFIGALRTLAQGASIRLGLDESGDLQTRAKLISAEITSVTDELIRLDAALQRQPGNQAAQGRSEALRARLADLRAEAAKTSEALKNYANKLDPKGSTANDTSDAFSRRFAATPKGKAPLLPPPGAGAKAALARKALEGELKSLAAGLEDARDLQAFHNAELQRQYDAGLLSLETFYAERQALADAALDKQRTTLDEEKAALERYRDAPGLKPEDKLDTENKLADVLRRKAVAEREAGQAAAASAGEQRKATVDLQAHIADLDEQIASLAGNEAGAAFARIGRQAAEAQRILFQAGQGPERAERFAALATQQVQLNDLRSQFTTLTTRAATAEETLLAQSAATGRSQVDTESAIAGARRGTLANLQALIDRTRELAAASQNPAALEFLQALEATYARLALDADPAIAKLREFGHEAGAAIASGFEDAIVAGASLRETLAAIEKDLLRLITRRLVTEPLADFLGNGINKLTGAVGPLAGQAAPSATQQAAGAALGVATQGSEAGAAVAATAAATTAHTANAAAVSAGTTATTALAASATAADAGIVALAASSAAADAGVVTLGAASTAADAALLALAGAASAAATALASVAASSGSQAAGTWLSALGELGFARGGAFARGGQVVAAFAQGGTFGAGPQRPGRTAAIAPAVPRVRGMSAAFARGDIFRAPTLFKFAAGGNLRDGVMGEAGPEAVMPLAPAADGSLGVRVVGAGGAVQTLPLARGADGKLGVELPAVALAQFAQAAQAAEAAPARLQAASPQGGSAQGSPERLGALLGLQLPAVGSAAHAADAVHAARPPARIAGDEEDDAREPRIVRAFAAGAAFVAGPAAAALAVLAPEAAPPADAGPAASTAEALPIRGQVLDRVQRSIAGRDAAAGTAHDLSASSGASPTAEPATAPAASAATTLHDRSSGSTPATSTATRSELLQSAVERMHSATLMSSTERAATVRELGTAIVVLPAALPAEAAVAAAPLAGPAPAAEPAAAAATPPASPSAAPAATLLAATPRAAAQQIVLPRPYRIPGSDARRAGPSSVLRERPPRATGEPRGAPRALRALLAGAAIAAGGAALPLAAAPLADSQAGPAATAPAIAAAAQALLAPPAPAAVQYAQVQLLPGAWAPGRPGATGGEATTGRIAGVTTTTATDRTAYFTTDATTDRSTERSTERDSLLRTATQRLLTTDATQAATLERIVERQRLDERLEREVHAFADGAFEDAERYHSGGIAGLAPDEVPAILRRGEEVLTQSDPRHRDNATGEGEGDGATRTLVVNVQATPGMSRDSAQQQGRDIGLGIQRSLRRLG